MSGFYITPRNKPHIHRAFGYWRYRRPPLSPIVSRTIRELAENIGL